MASLTCLPQSSVWSHPFFDDRLAARPLEGRRETAKCSVRWSWVRERLRIAGPAVGEPELPRGGRSKRALWILIQHSTYQSLTGRAQFKRAGDAPSICSRPWHALIIQKTPVSCIQNIRSGSRCPSPRCLPFRSHNLRLPPWLSCHSRRWESARSSAVDSL